MDAAEIPLRRLRLAPIAAALAVLAATALRALPLLQNRFHPDEALYAYFGRLIASGRDPLLAGALVDKPPLSFYLTALSLWLVGPHELSARLPELFASLASVALVFALGRQLYGPRVGALAAWLLALSPFAVLFSITVFIDPLLTAAVLWALWAAAAGRWRSLGAAIAVGFAIKQTALIFLPLILALAALARPAPATVSALGQRLLRVLRPMLLALASATVIIFGWDLLRHPAIGFWAQGYSDNLPGRFVRATEVLPRALAWVDLQHYFTGSTLVNALFLAALPLLIWAGWRSRSRAALADLFLTIFLLLYLAGYWLLAFNVWDRYLLPVLPLWFLLVARVADQAAGFLVRRLQTWRPGSLAPRIGRLAVPIVLVLLIGPASLQAARSIYPIGGDHGAYDGIDGAAKFLRAQPAGTVLYDHWLSWEWGYYLFDGPVYVAWFPTPAALGVDLRSFGRSSPRYLAVPAWEADGEVRAASSEAGYDFIPVYTAYRRDGAPTLTIYELRCQCLSLAGATAHD